MRRLSQLGPEKSSLQFQFIPRVPVNEAQRPNALVVAVVAVLMGFMFGFALLKGNVSSTSVIRGQFTFSDNTMLKMFLAAAATSSLVLNTLRIISATQDAQTAVVDEYVKHPRGVAALAIGGLLIGLGMQLSGSCPGTVFVQFGALSDGYAVVLAGGLVAAAVFGLLFRRLEATGVLSAGAGFVRAMPQVPGRWSGFAFAAMLYAVVAVVDWLSPHVPSPGSWHPALAGAVVGLLQLPATLVLGELIGSSQAYVTFVGSLALAAVRRERLSAYIQKYVRPAMDVYWPLLFAVAAVVGAAAARHIAGPAAAAHSAALAATAVTPAESFAGGFLLVFGSRFAAGCTSGHGISGMGSLATGSYIAVAAMFGGAIALGVVRAITGV